MQKSKLYTQKPFVKLEYTIEHLTGMADLNMSLMDIFQDADSFCSEADKDDVDNAKEIVRKSLIDTSADIDEDAVEEQVTIAYGYVYRSNCEDRAYKDLVSHIEETCDESGMNWCWVDSKGDACQPWEAEGITAWLSKRAYRQIIKDEHLTEPGHPSHPLDGGHMTHG